MKTVVEILEAARMAVIENKDEVASAVPDDELASYLVASRYIFEASEQVDRQKLLRLGAVESAIERARYDALASSLKGDGFDVKGLSRETMENIVEAKKVAKP